MDYAKYRRQVATAFLALLLPLSLLAVVDGAGLHEKGPWWAWGLHEVALGVTLSTAVMIGVYIGTGMPRRRPAKTARTETDHGHDAGLESLLQGGPGDARQQ